MLKTADNCNLDSYHGIFFVGFAFDHSRRKTIKRSQIFEIKAEQNHAFRSLLDIFSESENIDAEVRYFVIFTQYKDKKTVSVKLLFNF